MDIHPIDVFFYGLYMDDQVLRGLGVAAENPRPGYVSDFGLCIGQRATLTPGEGARAYGMVYSLGHDDLQKLYGAPGLEHYQPVSIIVHSMDGETLLALCYILDEAPGPDEHDARYAANLQAVLRRLEFPPDYVDSVSSKV